MLARKQDQDMVLGRNLQGLRVLVVEDEALVSMLLEDTLTDLGCRMVSIATSLSDAMNTAASSDYDAVVLDVNLHGEHTFPVAELLAEKGIPFIFSTGYGAAGIPETFQHVPILQKPFQEHDLKKALSAALTAKAA